MQYEHSHTPTHCPAAGECEAFRTRLSASPTRVFHTPLAEPTICSGGLRSLSDFAEAMLMDRVGRAVPASRFFCLSSSVFCRPLPGSPGRLALPRKPRKAAVRSKSDRLLRPPAVCSGGLRPPAVEVPHSFGGRRPPLQKQGPAAVSDRRKHSDSTTGGRRPLLQTTCDISGPNRDALVMERNASIFSSDGERAGVRGRSDWIRRMPNDN